MKEWWSENYVLLTPIYLGIGIALYFGLSFEPSLYAGFLVLLFFSVVWISLLAFQNVCQKKYSVVSPFLFCLLFSIVLLFSTRHKARWLSIPIFLFCLALIAVAPKPDVLISNDGKLVGVQSDSKLYVSNKKSERFTRQIWSEMLAIDDVNIHSFPKSGCVKSVCCSESMCTVEADKVKVAVLKNRYNLPEICRDKIYKFIISSFSVRQKNCHAQILDSKNRANTGAVALYKNKKGFEVKVVKGNGQRPWHISN